MKKNILFVVDNLKMGGVTKVLGNLLNRLDYSLYDVDLLVLHYYEDMKFMYPSSIKIITAGNDLNLIDENIGKLLKEKNIIKIIKKALFAFSIKTGIIKKKILTNRKNVLNRKYDIEIAFGDGFPYLYTAYGDAKKKIAWMHSDVLVKDYSARYYNRMKKAIQNMDACVAVSEKVGESYIKKYSANNVNVIQNVIDDDEIIKKSNLLTQDIEFDKKQLNFISVGRLDYSKNYEMMLKNAIKLKNEGFKFKVYIIGDGEEKEKLDKIIIENNMEDVFILCGRRDNPYAYVKNADMFLLSSRYEGLPTVIIEALILHVPCLSTDVAGVKQILNGKGGIIAKNDEEDFYIKWKSILLDQDIITKLKDQLKDYRYDNDVIIKKINKLFNNA